MATSQLQNGEQEDRYFSQKFHSYYTIIGFASEAKSQIRLVPLRRNNVDYKRMLSRKLLTEKLK
jgi:hypothetical protein